MNDQEAESTLNDWLRELAEFRDMEAEGKRGAQGVLLMIKGLVIRFPDLNEHLSDLDQMMMIVSPAPPASPDNTPRGAEAVRVVLQTRPGIGWLVSDLVNELRERGWLPESDNPANAVRTALERLREQDGSDIYKEPSGRNVQYVYDPDRDPSYGRYADGEEPF